MGSKAPNFDPKSVKMDQEWVQNGEDGPKWPIRGLKYDFWGPGTQKNNPPGEKVVQNGGQNGQKIDQKTI